MLRDPKSSLCFQFPTTILCTIYIFPVHATCEPISSCQIQMNISAVSLCAILSILQVIHFSYIQIFSSVLCSLTPLFYVSPVE